MKIFEQLLDLVSAFTLKRAFSLVVIVTILICSAWLIDNYASYSALYRIDKSLGLLERIDALDRKGPASKDLTAVREDILMQLHALNLRATSKETPKPADTHWLTMRWAKMAWGALPWFVVSLFSVSSIRKREKNAWAGFFALQLFSIIFAFANLAIPDTGTFWFDRLLVPWGIFFVCAVIPMSIAAVTAFRKVRDSSAQKTILNNLRQIAAAADMFALEHGRDPATLQEIVGPDKYIKSLTAVDGERYDLIDLRRDQPLVVVRKSGDVVRFER